LDIQSVIGYMEASKIVVAYKIFHRALIGT